MSQNTIFIPAGRIVPDISFSPFLPSTDGKPGNRNPRIEHAFIKSFVIDRLEPPGEIRVEGGTAYKAIYNEFFANESDPITISVIGSFQKWDTGNFVVIRKERK